MVEFQQMLEREDMQATLRSFDVDVTQTSVLFRLMDENGSMTISAKEFIDGCTRLRTTARGIDLWQIRLQNREIIQNLKQFFEHLKDQKEISEGDRTLVASKSKRRQSARHVS